MAGALQNANYIICIKYTSHKPDHSSYKVCNKFHPISVTVTDSLAVVLMVNGYYAGYSGKACRLSRMDLN